MVLKVNKVGIHQIEVVHTQDTKVQPVEWVTTGHPEEMEAMQVYLDITVAMVEMVVVEDLEKQDPMVKMLQLHLVMEVMEPPDWMLEMAAMVAMVEMDKEVPMLSVEQMV